MDIDNHNSDHKTSRTFLQNLVSSGFFRFLKKFFCTKKETIKEERKIREDLSEKKIDKMVKDSFPASDPPSTY